MAMSEINNVIGKLQSIQRAIDSEYESARNEMAKAEKKKAEADASCRELIARKQELQELNKDILAITNISDRLLAVEQRESALNMKEFLFKRECEEHRIDIDKKNKKLDSLIKGHDREIKAIKKERSESQLKEESFRKVAKALIN